MRVLIIEDEPLIALAQRDDLKELGVGDIVLASSVAEAIRLSEEQRPNLIIADYRLSDGTGVEAVRKINPVGIIPTVYACAISLDVLREVPDAIILTKPFTFEALRAAVAKAQLYSRMVG